MTFMQKTAVLNLRSRVLVDLSAKKYVLNLRSNALDDLSVLFALKGH